MIDTLNFYIGTEEKTRIAEKVLDFSIRRRASCKVNITPMIGPDWQVPKGLHQGTGFSLRRFLIPSKQNFQGIGVYVDADMVVFRDVSELIKYAEDLVASNKQVACTFQPDKFNKKPWPQSAVMIINCAACTDWQPDKLWKKLKDGYNYVKFMHLSWISSPPVQIPTYWNNLNVYNAETRLLHYTKEPEQPWYKPTHPLAKLWEKELKEALDAGAVTKQELSEALSRWGKATGDHRKSNGLHPHYKKFLV